MTHTSCSIDVATSECHCQHRSVAGRWVKGTPSRCLSFADVFSYSCVSYLVAIAKVISIIRQSHITKSSIMSIKQRRPSATNLHHLPSTSFSTFSSAASATSVGTSRSGGSRLLFGEIDLTSDRCTYTSFLLASSIVNDLTRNLQPPRPSRLSAAWCCQIAALSSNSG